MLLLIFTGLAWMMYVMSMMKFLINYGVSFGNFVHLISLMIPFIISIIVPFVMFISVMFVYSKMISENEVTVMMSSGLSPWQLARPAINLAAVVTILHLILNIWLVPLSQASFYNTQWDLRYGLANMKLQESAFTQLADGLVVYVDNVAGNDLNQVMLSDQREKESKILIFAERGKLVSTDKGLSIVTDNGSLQMDGQNGYTIGTFDSFDMDLNLASKDKDEGFRVRRISTGKLLNGLLTQEDVRHHKLTLTEMYTRCLNPFMSLIVTILCTLILLRTSLLRRRVSFAPAMAVCGMAVVMAGFMSASNMMSSVTDLGILAASVFVVLGLLFGALIRK
ncbi:MAG: LptF/LptG family permease [Alphaproteobacteria bacterium]|nr:LptF/LptG family permease [Alphaproteobacteria bacterium]